MSTFILYPAIDLKAGQCVRLYKGDMDAVTVYSDSPAEQANAFTVGGAEWLHIVDLDGAVDGSPKNKQAVADILSAVDVPVQLGGGIRDLATMESWLDAGVSRLILGTLAVKNPDLVREAARRFEGHIAVGIDARGDKVAVEGWGEESDMHVHDLAARFEDAGISALIYTDIDRDGTLEGPSLERTAALSEAVSIPVIASGGIKDKDDISALRNAGTIAGAITGKALYAGRMTLAEALNAARGNGGDI